MAGVYNNALAVINLEKDKNIFANGWDRNNAYIFGWIMSDGCLVREGRNKNAHNVRISLNDGDMAEWLYQYMCNGCKIYREGNNYIVRYRNKDGVEFMIKSGLSERKSLIMQYPSVPQEVMADFIRGYFDGDGSIVVNKTRYNTYAQASFTCGSADFLTGLQQALSDYNIASHIYKDGRKTNNSSYLRIIKTSELEKLYSLMYKDIPECPYLQRKYEKYDVFMKNHEHKYQSHIA